MKNVIVIVGLIIGIFTLVNAGTVTKAGTRIVNGTVAADRTKFPYQVSLRIKSTDFHFCGGTIIAQGVILTAAHCFENYYASQVVAVVGDLNKDEDSQGTVRMELAEVKSHPKFNSTSVENDVAVALTKQNFTWSSTVNYLPLASVTPVAGTQCYVSGWGSVYYNGPASSRLLYVMVPVINKTTCSLGYGNFLLNGMFCAGYMEGTADSCSGDSGGPLACNGVVAGIVSWGYECSHWMYPGVYTDVAYYKKWIEDQIAGYVPSSGHSVTLYLPIMSLSLCLGVILMK